MPPSGQWSSTTTIRPPVALAAAASVSPSIGFTEYASITRTRRPPFARSSAAFTASCSVMPAAITATRSSLPPPRTTLLPPIGNASSAV